MPQEIHALGSSRLQDVLLEQVGINIVPQINGLGNGLQLQGLNPDYTLILIDGEPVVGRYTGSLELNRITAGEIKK
ncbi:MAG: Plug domain-containing protein [Saprospiraceae bacterium]|nr:Plug domain-containing protein [Saprospiraceae bacterium]